MLKKIALVLVVLIAGLLGYAATRPDSFRVERSTTVQAPPDRLHPMVEDFRRWQSWSPWEALDPAMKRTFSGAASGKGSVYEWSGNKDVGRGRMEVLDSAPPGKVVIKLDFIEPFEGHNTTTFSFEPKDGGTRVVWVMEGPSPFVTKLMGVFFNMDQMIGRDFEKGLANMKAAAEKAAG